MAGSQRFITEDELEKKLNMYDRLGSSTKAAAIAEENVKNYVRKQLEQAHLIITQKLEEKIVQSFQKSEATFKKAVENSQSTITDTVNKTMQYLILKTKNEIVNDVHLVIRGKTEEIRKAINSRQAEFEASFEKSVLTKFTNFQSQVKEELMKSESLIIEKAIITADSGVRDVTSDVSKAVKEQLHKFYGEVDELIINLRNDLTAQMNNKLVDKQAIEQRMEDVREELANKAQQIINFNIEQARQNMEMSARAEISEGLKTSTAEILSGLS